MAIKPSGFLRLWMPASKSSLPSPHDSDTCSEIYKISRSETEVSFDAASEQKGYFLAVLQTAVARMLLA